MFETFTLNPLSAFEKLKLSMVELQPSYTELVARKKKNTPRQGGPLQVVSRVMTPYERPYNWVTRAITNPACGWEK